MPKINVKKLIKILVIIGLVVLGSIYRAGPVSAATPGPFTCSSDFYQEIDGQLKLLNPVSGQYTNIGSQASFDYNAIGYDTQNNYIYGIEEGGSNGDLIKVANDGSTTNLGLPANLPTGNNYYAGDFDLNGNLYLTTFNSNTIYEINVNSSPLTATPITITGDSLVNGSDNVYINSNGTGYLYLIYGDSLSVVNLTTDTATTGTVGGPSGWLSGGDDFGAGWTDSAGELFFSNNATGTIYQILNYNNPTPTAEFQVSGTVTSNNDGASCALATQSPFDPPVANNASFTTTVNTALNETTSLLNNDVGNSLTVTSNTNPTHGSVTVNSNGTFDYTPDPGFVGTDSFTYTVTDGVGRTATATVTLTVDPAAVTTPSTGYGAPGNSSTLIMVLASISLVLTSSGLRMIYSQKRIKNHIYRLV
jgi:VCBS repeat-containing protein